MACICVLFPSAWVGATHIVGGELNYTSLDENNYKIELQLYIDCENGNPSAIAQDEFAQIAVFSKKTGLLIPNLSFDFDRGNPTRVTKTNYNCIKASPNACVDAYTYDTIINLPYLEGGYILSFQRCCRNHTILNLNSPATLGANFWTEINNMEDRLKSNSSPYFKNLPPNFLCTNTELVFDHSATDADGDELVYEFFTPFTGGDQVNPRPDVSEFETPPFSNVAYKIGYSAQEPMDASPNIYINRQTGELRITPTFPGQFVVGIVVKEYRNGQLIGFTQRDYQFNVQNCEFEVASAFVAPEINCDKEVIFNNGSQNATSYFWDFGDTATNQDTSILKGGFYSYPEVGTYRVMLVASVGNCADTVFKDITIWEHLEFKLPNDTLICPGEHINLKPSKLYKDAQMLWSTGQVGDTQIRISEPGEYSIRMILGTCDGKDSMNLWLDSAHIDLTVDELYCNQNVMEYQGVVKASGDFSTIAWTSSPDLFNGTYAQEDFIFDEPAQFVITGETKEGCRFREELNVKDWVADTSKTVMYNTFTPNEDGFNDVFPEENPNYFYDLSVFNRWGVKVYSGKNIPWKGTDLTNGTYFYTIDLKSCDVKEKITGVITLIR